jgi:hypothetical protein
MTRSPHDWFRLSVKSAVVGRALHPITREVVIWKSLGDPIAIEFPRNRLRRSNQIAEIIVRIILAMSKGHEFGNRFSWSGGHGVLDLSRK